ncbi:MAG: zinc-dependent metalloprotease, partial [Pseudomonadota bacterium]
TALLAVWRNSAMVASRYVGGVQVDRAVVGQDGGGDPLTPIAADRQREAMAMLADKVFAPDAFDMPPALLRQTLPQRRGFDHFGKTEDPKVHDAVLAIQSVALDHLLHPVVMKRLTDSAEYGNDYTLGQMMTELTDAIFKADAKGEINSYRQQLQANYVARLSAMADGGDAAKAYHAPAVAMASYSLKRIGEMLDGKGRRDVESAAHVYALQLKIERALATQS